MRREAEENWGNKAPLRKGKERGSVCRTLFGLTDGLGSRNSKNATAPRSSLIPDVETGSGMYLPPQARMPVTSSATLVAGP